MIRSPRDIVQVANQEEVLLQVLQWLQDRFDLVVSSQGVGPKRSMRALAQAHVTGVGGSTVEDEEDQTLRGRPRRPCALHPRKHRLESRQSEHRARAPQTGTPADFPLLHGVPPRY